jgi:hypothetical protein
MTKKKVLFNFVPVAAGGGLQNALSFLSFLAQSHDLDFDFLVVCRKKSKIEEYCKKNDIDCVGIAEGLLPRLYFEFLGGALLAKKNRSNVVFSLFGGSPFFIHGIARKICGFAYSNIIESNVDFWWFCGKKDRFIKKGIDFFRLESARNSSCVVLETDRLAALARDGVFLKSDIEVIYMSPSSLVTHRNINRANEIVEKEKVRILYLCGAHENKRIKKLAPIMSHLMKSGLDVSLVTTLPVESKVFKDVYLTFLKFGAVCTLENIGPISPDSLNVLLDSVDGIINVALLESFSNNWVEAWASSLPLFVTDAAWARDSCGDAAVYIDIDQPVAAAEKIKSTYASTDKIKGMITAGKGMLKRLPNPEQKFNNYINLIERYL